MRKTVAILVLIFVTVLVVLLDRPLGSLPALGRLLDPVNGAWASAEATGRDMNLKMDDAHLQAPVNVWFDERMVPHIHAANDHDLYYMQGYIHAYFRLWQMDLQTRAAGGRVSEILGEKALNFDREQRRKGMVWGAENSLAAMEADPRTKLMLDAYTDGVNHYIRSLNYRRLPIEYKLMGFTPEPWTNIKCALLLKYMADDLTGKVDDIPLTVLRDKYGEEDQIYQWLYPERLPGVGFDKLGSTPVIPAGTMFGATSFQRPLAPPDSIAFVHLDSADFEVEEPAGKGSNNWAIHGSRTQSGVPILANDPHLGLNLPSLWFEVQMQTPGLNVYGVSLPGAPGVVIGFNEQISWGFTNNYRDVKDFYAVELNGNESYLFEGRQLPLKIVEELIKIKGRPDFIDTVRYTLHGPVIYDESFHGPGGLKKPLAMTWMAHRGTNELLSLYLLNRAGDYAAFVTAVQHFHCPAQNIAYADKAGNIAMWTQGQFVNKWHKQGRYVMNGTDSATLWGQLIPMQENPHVLNPSQGYVSSANQVTTDSTYPYYYNGNFYDFRAWRINQVLAQLQHATINDMFTLQNDVYSILAATTLPVLLQHLPKEMTNDERKYADMLKGWNYRLDAGSKAATVFQVWWEIIYKNFGAANEPIGLKPSPEVVMNWIHATDYANKNNYAPFWENMQQDLPAYFHEAVDSLEKIKEGGLEWAKAKRPMVRHLTKLPAFSYLDLPIGGWGNTPNAMKVDHGPSWRMVVQMGKEIEAYGVYPGGQSGNPGSKYYATFLDKWVKGEYYRLLFLPNSAQQNNKDIKYTWTAQPEK